MSNGAPIPDDWLQDEIRFPIAFGNIDPLRIISNVDSTILNPLKMLGIKENIVEYFILFILPWNLVSGAWTGIGFEEIAIIRIFQEEIHIPLQIDVDQKGGLVLEVLIKQFYFFFFVA